MKEILSIVSLIFLICLSFGCQDKEAVAELEAMKAQATLEEQNKELILHWFEEDEQGNDDIWKEVTSPEYQAHFSSNAKPVTLEEHFQAWQLVKEAFPDLKETIEDILAADDKVIVRATIRGTHKGEYMGIQPTGREVECSVIEIYRISQGKVVECWMSFDFLGLYQQLGMELTPKEAQT